MKIGLFFGTFNPIHIGHLVIANFFVEFTDLDKIWFVVSPQNPLKKSSELLDEKNRLYMVNLAVEDNPKFSASNIEFHLSRPSYTIDTLTYLKEKHPKKDFALIMGSDNLDSLPKWKNYELLLKNYEIYAYKRIGFEKNPFSANKNVRLFDVPLLNISATFLRKSIKEGKTMRHYFLEKVFKYIDEMNFYKK